MPCPFQQWPAPEVEKEVKAWLAHPAGAMFRRLLTERIILAHLNAGQGLALSAQHGLVEFNSSERIQSKHSIDADEAAASAAEVQIVLDVLESYSDAASEQFFTIEYTPLPR
jgi:hypothetical protein